MKALQPGTEGIHSKILGSGEKVVQVGILRALHSLCVGQDIQEFPAVVERGDWSTEGISG